MSITDKEKLIAFIQLRIKNLYLNRAIIDFLESARGHYFWSVPASSSGKYHPSYALGDGGLVRHTLAALLIAEELLEISTIKSDYERDIIFASLALHDFYKQGLPPNNSKTIFEHPLVAAEEWEKYMANSKNVSEDIVTAIANCIRSHMGQWNTSKYSKTVLPIPSTKLQKFVHACDYLASRKRIEVNMDFESIIT